MVACLSGVLLLYTSQAVQDAERDLREVKAELNQEQELIHVLQAEWAFLSAPERIDELASEYLDLHGDEPRITPSLTVIKQGNSTAKSHRYTI